MANQEHVHLRAPVPFQPNASQLDEMPLLKENHVPRYLFRLYSPKSAGTTSSSYVVPPSENSTFPGDSLDIFSMAPDDAAWRLNHHLHWWPDHEERCNLVSWSCSLLFLLQYALYKHRHLKDGSSFSDIHVMIIDTRKFPPRNFVRDMEMMQVFAPFSSEFPQYNGLQNFLQLRLRPDYYFGEYLSQGVLDLTSKGVEASFETLICLGLFELMPELANRDNWNGWAKPVLQIREAFQESVPRDTTRAEVRKAITIAEGSFGEPWTIPVAVMLLSLKPRKANDRIIIEGFKAMFSGELDKWSPALRLLRKLTASSD